MKAKVKKKDYFVTFLSFLLVLLGLSSVFGYVTQIHIIESIGKASAASPLTVPFSNMLTGYSLFDYQFSLLLTTENGKEYTINRVEDLRVGPPGRRETIYALNSTFPVTSPSQREILIKHMFCDTDIQREHLNIHERIKEIHFFARVREYEIEKEIDEIIICSD